MRAVNLYTITRKIKKDIYPTYEMTLSEREKCLKTREEEIGIISIIVNNFIFHKAEKKIFENWFYSFSIPHIAKEFDLIKIGKNRVAINIEIKSQEISLERIEEQLKQNRAYLSIVADEVHSFSVVNVADKQCKVYSYDGELNESSFLMLINKISEVEESIDNRIEDLFKPKDYLVSPLNEPEKFLKNQYFLNNQQAEVKRTIINGIYDQNKLWGINGAAGTGKSLLLYDIAKTLSKNFKVAVIHSGILCEGHVVLNNRLENVDVIGAKSFNETIINKYDVLCVDEAHRLYKNNIDEILKAYENNIIKGVIFSYDYEQVLSKSETRRNTPKRLTEMTNFREKTLSNKIRSNKEVYSYIRNLLNLKDKAKEKFEYKNIDVVYANNDTEADALLSIYMEKGYQAITFTPSQYVSNPIDHYSKYKNSHEVIGQEFDKVIVLMDNNFSYDTNGELLTKTHPNPEYLFCRLLYQNLSRAREKLCIIVLDNEDVFEKLLMIKSGLLTI